MVNAMMVRGRQRGNAGLTLIEVIIAMSILAVLASAVIPLAATTVRRTREIELRRSLREMRTAIDQYKADFDRADKEKRNPTPPLVKESGYPKELEELVTGNDWWGMRSMADDPDSLSWGGEDVFDVYSQSTETGLDGTPYNTW